MRKLLILLSYLSRRTIQGYSRSRKPCFTKKW